MLVRSGAAEDQMGVAVDQPRGHPGATERDHLARLAAGELGAFAGADDAPVLDADRAVFDESQRIAGGRLHGRDSAVDEEAVPHAPIPLCEGG